MPVPFGRQGLLNGVLHGSAMLHAALVLMALVRYWHNSSLAGASG